MQFFNVMENADAELFPEVDKLPLAGDWT